MLPAVAVILALAARWSVSPYSVQYDELTIRAICAMRYPAAALTVQLQTARFGRSKKCTAPGCASLLQRQCWLDNTAR